MEEAGEVIKRDVPSTRAHSSITAMDLSGVLLTDDTVNKLLLLCELRLQTMHTQTLLVQYLLLQSRKKEKTTKEEILLGAPLDIQKTTIWSVGESVEGTAH